MLTPHTLATETPAADNRFDVLTVTARLPRLTVPAPIATPEGFLVADKLIGRRASLEHPDFAAAATEDVVVTVSALFLNRRQVEGSFAVGEPARVALGVPGSVWAGVVRML